MTQIIECTVENILGAKHVHFEPNGQSVTIGGKNGQGKTSALWALVMALGGKGELPAEPVRNGAESGRVEIKLDKFNVTMEVFPDRTTKLKVETNDGARFPSPQNMLDALFGHLSFDPGKFMTFDRAKRLKTLQELTGIDAAKFETELKGLEEVRRDYGRELKMFEAQVSGKQIDSTLPDEPTAIASVLNQYNEALQHNRNRENLQQRILNRAANIDAIKNKIFNLQKELDDAQLMQKKDEDVLDSTPVVDVESIKVKLDSAQETNNKIVENQRVKKCFADLEQAQNRYSKAASDILAKRAEQTKALCEAKYPIEELSFKEDDITYRGIPFEQLSESEKWEISTAIGFALNPKGVVFMSHSGGLDSDARDRVRERAAKLGVQLFLEVVDTPSDVQIIISEGRVFDDKISGPTLQTSI